MGNLKIGMLWQDDDKKSTFADKVIRAAKYYLEKYGLSPNCCHVHPSMMPLDTDTVSGITIVPSKAVMINHFWTGVE